MQINPAVFKAYDIRGTVPEQLNPEFALALGRAFGMAALAGSAAAQTPNQGSVTVGELEIDFGENIEWWVKAFTQSWATDRGGPGSLLGTPTLGNYDIALNSPALGLMYNPGFGYSTLGGLNGPVPGSVTGANGLTNNPALTDIRTFSDLPPS